MREIDSLAVMHAQALSEALGPEYAALRDALVGGLAIHGATFADLNQENDQALLHNRVVAGTVATLPRQLAELSPDLYIKEGDISYPFYKSSRFECTDELEVQNLNRSLVWIRNYSLEVQGKDNGRDEEVDDYMHHQHWLPFYIVGHSRKYGALITPPFIHPDSAQGGQGDDASVYHFTSRHDRHGVYKTMYAPGQTYRLHADPRLRMNGTSQRRSRKLEQLVAAQQTKELSAHTMREIYDKQKRVGVVTEEMPGALRVKHSSDTINRFDLYGPSDRVSTHEMQLSNVMNTLGLLAVQFGVGENHVALLRDAVAEAEAR